MITVIEELSREERGEWWGHGFIPHAQHHHHHHHGHHFDAFSNYESLVFGICIQVLSVQSIR